MIYRLIQELQQKAIPVTQACRVLEVSRAGYYQHLQRGPRQPDVIATVELKAEFADSGRSYGSRRRASALQAKGHAIGRYRVRRLMREAALRPVWRRKFIHTTDSMHDLPVAQNLLNRQFDVAAPNQAWTSDITYVRTQQGWLYLAAVMDLFSRKIVGWAMAPTMPTELVAAALRMALQQRQPPAGLLLHSDRGSQYARLEYQALLAQHGIRCSMSRSQAAKRLRKQFGVGPQTAAILMAVAGDDPERLRSEAALAALCGASPLQASSGKTNRHRLNRGGDRSAKNALWTIAMVRMRSEPGTQAYVTRRTMQGMSSKEIQRCLKRYIARELYPLILADLADAAKVS